MTFFIAYMMFFFVSGLSLYTEISKKAFALKT